MERVINVVMNTIIRMFTCKAVKKGLKVLLRATCETSRKLCFLAQTLPPVVLLLPHLNAVAWWCQETS